MAESADILTGDHQQVILPDLNAGCSMADMADLEEVEEAWEALARVTDIDQVVPDHLHELVGRAQGLRRRARRRRVHVDQRQGRARVGAVAGRPGRRRCRRATGPVLPRPAPRPQHRAPARASPRTTCASGTPASRLGGLTEAEAKESTFLLWKGHCSVHQRFRPEHIEAFRAEHPDGIVVAHPECAHESCALADQVGSTDFIIKAVEAAPAGFGHRRRHRDPPGQPAERRDPGQDRRVARPARVPVLDDVPHRRRPPVLGAREPRRGQGRQPDHRRCPTRTEWAKVALDRMLEHHLRLAEPPHARHGVPSGARI